MVQKTAWKHSRFLFFSKREAYPSENGECQSQSSVVVNIMNELLVSFLAILLCAAFDLFII